MFGIYGSFNCLRDLYTSVGGDPGHIDPELQGLLSCTSAVYGVGTATSLIGFAFGADAMATCAKDYFDSVRFYIKAHPADDRAVIRASP